MKLYKEQCNVDARRQMFSSPTVEIWNSLPAAVVLSHTVAVINEILPSWRSVAFYDTFNNMSSYVLIIGLASLHVMYFTAM